MCRIMRVLMIAIVFTGVHRNTAQYKMCREVYNIGPNIKEGGQALVYFNIARKAEARVVIKTFTKACDYEVEHTVLSTLIEKQDKEGRDIWFPKLYPSCIMPFRTRPSLVMEFVKKEFVFSDATRLDELVDIVHQLLWAIARLHDMGFSHNDLKADNIRITNTGVVKLIDFGCATNISEPFNSNIMGGTPRYSPPEMLRRSIEESYNEMILDNINGEPISPIDTDRLDSWTLGIITFELLTGTSLYDDQELSRMEECTKKSNLRSSSLLISVGLYFYVKEIIFGLTNRSVQERELTNEHPIIDQCQQLFRAVSTVMNRFTRQLSQRLSGTRKSRCDLQKDVVELWTLVNSLLQFENSARSDVHDVLENPIFERFTRQNVVQRRSKCVIL